MQNLILDRNNETHLKVAQWVTKIMSFFILLIFLGTGVYFSKPISSYIKNLFSITNQEDKIFDKFCTQKVVEPYKFDVKVADNNFADLKNISEQFLKNGDMVGPRTLAYAMSAYLKTLDKLPNDKNMEYAKKIFAYSQTKGQNPKLIANTEYDFIMTKAYELNDEFAYYLKNQAIQNDDGYSQLKLYLFGLHNNWRAGITNQKELDKIDPLILIYNVTTLNFLAFNSTVVEELSKKKNENFSNDKKLKKEELFALLEKGEGVLNEERVGRMLYIVAENILEENKFDNALKWYDCSANKYYNTDSMFRLYAMNKGFNKNVLAMILNIATSSVVLQNEINRDVKKVYFWAMATMYTDMLHEGHFVDASYGAANSLIGFIDGVQNTPESLKTFTVKEIYNIEEQARKFVEKKYPIVPLNNFEVGTHSVGAIIDNMSEQYNLPKETVKGN